MGFRCMTVTMQGCKNSIVDMEFHISGTWSFLISVQTREVFTWWDGHRHEFETNQLCESASVLFIILVYKIVTNV